jgi:hypothetical protein
MAAKLETFLSNNLEGYLFEDIETLKGAVPRDGMTCGAAGYPLLMTVFAGIELLGSLVSASTFDKDKGANRFDEFWQNYLYTGDSSRQAAGRVLYKLARHGLAHAFLVKGDLDVYKGAPYMHLTRSASGTVSVDAVELATDLRSTYESKIKPVAIPGSPLFNTMSTRLAEMEAEYARQASKVMPSLMLPAPLTSTTATVTSSSPTVSGSVFPATYKSSP